MSAPAERNRPRFSRGPRRGIGLVEAAVATVIVGIMLVAALATLEASVRARQVTTGQAEAEALASLLMNEILSRCYEEPADPVAFGLETGETASDRTGWDDVDDYHGFSQNSPTDAGGATIPSGRRWIWQASVALADPVDPNVVASLDSGLKRITVTVSDSRGVTLTSVALRSRVAPRDRTVAATTSFVGHVAIHLEVGGGYKGNFTSGTVLVNEPPP